MAAGSSVDHNLHHPAVRLGRSCCFVVRLAWLAQRIDPCACCPAPCMRMPAYLQVRGVAARQDKDVSLVLQLEELGCVTLMPVTHLLPSQLSQLCSEAGLSAARFPSGSLRAQGHVGERATAALQVQSVGSCQGCEATVCVSKRA